MKAKILPFVLGIVVAVSGLMVATKISGCSCSPICVCSHCDCHK